MKFLFVGSNICRQIPSDSQSPTTPLLLANDKCCNSGSGLSPYSVMTMPDTQKRANNHLPKTTQALDRTPEKVDLVYGHSSDET